MNEVMYRLAWGENEDVSAYWQIPISFTEIPFNHNRYTLPG